MASAFDMQTSTCTDCVLSLVTWTHNADNNSIVNLQTSLMNTIGNMTMIVCYALVCCRHWVWFIRPNELLALLFTFTQLILFDLEFYDFILHKLARLPNEWLTLIEMLRSNDSHMRHQTRHYLLLLWRHSIIPTDAVLSSAALLRITLRQI